MNKQNKRNRMILLGFDGASWNVLSPLLKRGKLPHFEKVMSRGVYANMRTPEPPFTPIIWTTILSGVEAKRHGIKSFFNTRDDLLVPRLWDILISEGKSAGVAGHYFTYPIDKKLDFCIPSHFDRGIETSPHYYQFIREITQSFEARDFSVNRFIHNSIAALKNGLSFDTITYGIRTVMSLLSNRKYFDWQYRAQRLFMDLSFDTFINAYAKFQPDFASFYSPLPDTICHKYWCFHEPEHFSNVQQEQVGKYGKVIEDTYIHIDMLLGKLLEQIPSETQLCIVSDHGFQKMDYSKDRLVLVPEKMLKVLNFGDKITITNLGHQILIQPKSNTDNVELLKTILSVLETGIVPETGFTVFDDLFIAEEPDRLYCRIYYEIEDMNARIILDGKEMKMSDIAKIGSEWTGRHHMEEGVFFLSGEGVAVNGKREIIEAADVMPTLLRLQGCSVADDLDGTIMNDVIDPMWEKQNPVRKVKTYEGIIEELDCDSDKSSNEDEVTKKLKSLGYM